MRCPHPSRAAWRSGCIQRIQTYCCETRTYPQLTRLLVDGLERWLSGDDQPLLNPDQYPTDVHSIIRRQHQVGWKHIMLGRFVTDWRRVQGLYSDRITTVADSANSPTHKKTPEQWLIGLINVLWEQWFILWAERNQDLHGRDAQKRQSQLRRDVHRQLQEIYNNKPFMDPKVRSLLLQNPEAHSAQSLQVTTNWLRIHVPIVKANVRKVRRMALEGMRSIRTYFSPLPNPNTVP
ncbi:hypothetical protein MHU86_14648 [Fragilaria crotonensis]|nr:hypothetical protein MHU86_14648 [Fragilaria crotonensis]